MSTSTRPLAHTEPRPWEWLYDLVGVGMWAFVNARFDVEVIGRVPRVGAGQLWVVSHRAETDVPLVGGLLMIRGGMWRHRADPRVHFAARDDLFEPGVVSAGLRLPRPAARCAWPLSPGPWLAHVRTHPVRRPTGLKLAQVIHGLDAALPLADVLAPPAFAGIRQRASELGRPPPVTVGQVRDGAYARVLWRDAARDDLCGERGAAVWHAHTTRSVGDIRRLVDLVRRREPLVLFPEGSVSSNGDIGHVGAILDLIDRRGKPAAILPVGIAYDPLRRGRTLAAVSVGDPVVSDGGDIGPLVSLGLRRATPVTVAQVVARTLAEVVGEGGHVIEPGRLLDTLTDTAARARRDGRPVSSVLASPRSRRRAVTRALDALRARGCISGAAPGRLRVEPDVVRADPVVSRLVHEDRAVWHADAARRDP